MDWIPFLYDLVKCCFLPSLVTSIHPPSLSITPKCSAAPHTLDCWINHAKIGLYKIIINERIHRVLLLVSFYHIIISSPNYFSRPFKATGWALISMDRNHSKVKIIVVLKPSLFLLIICVNDNKFIYTHHLLPVTGCSLALIPQLGLTVHLLALSTQTRQY